MVDTCQEKILIPTFSSLRSKIYFFNFYCQGRDHHVTTVYQSDIRGLATCMVWLRRGAALISNREFQ